MWTWPRLTACATPDATLKKEGVQIAEPSADFVKAVEEKSKPIIEKWLAAAKAKGIDADKAYAEFKQEIKNVTAGK